MVERAGRVERWRPTLEVWRPMRPLRLVVLLALASVLVACGSEDVTMPDVTGQKLDVAYNKLKSAGLDDRDKIEVKGGGIFGVLVESNWTVCKQSPAAGKTVSASTLTVKRSCDNGGDKDSDEPKETLPSPTPTASPPPKLPEVITARNSRQFATLLRLGDYCSNKIERFAKKHAGDKIKFNGSVSAMSNHGSYDTRFDILVGAGDKGPNAALGPAFQFYDKSIVNDLNLTGKNIPDNLMVGQKYTFSAEIEEYDADGCLLRLDPVETKVR
jgi:hypothetical protein